MGGGEHETRFLKEEEKEGSRFHERKDENDFFGTKDSHKKGMENEMGSPHKSLVQTKVPYNNTHLS